ncbi:MAG: DUF4261 domain-containing protein [Bacteroidales bacterium]
MGILNRLKGKQSSKKSKNRLPEKSFQPLQARLMYKELPNLNKEELRLELGKLFNSIVEKDVKKNHYAYTFPEKQIEHNGEDLDAQIQVFLPEKENFIGVHPQVSQQSWYFPKNQILLSQCTHELLISDFPYNGIDYGTRLEVFNNFLLAFIKVTKPLVLFSIPGQKVLGPRHITGCLDKESFNPLFTCINLRTYNVKENQEDEESEVLFDTIGLNSFGLDDFQIQSYGLDSNKISEILWKCAVESIQGKTLENGDTVSGMDNDIHWTCKRVKSTIPPERTVIELIQS